MECDALGIHRRWLTSTFSRLGLANLPAQHTAPIFLQFMPVMAGPVGYLVSTDTSILRRSEFRAVSRSCELLAYSSDKSIFLYTQCRPGGTLKMEEQNADRSGKQGRKASRGQRRPRR